LVGEKGLSLNEFNEHFRPRLEKKGYEVKDLVQLGNPNGVLISLVGKDNLEKAVSDTTKEVYEKIGEMYQTIDSNKMSAHNFQVDFFETLGVYSLDNTASGNFPLFAQRYLCDATKKHLSYVKEEVQSLMGKKLSDF
jgi:hypothetical protein